MSPFRTKLHLLRTALSWWIWKKWVWRLRKQDCAWARKQCSHVRFEKQCKCGEQTHPDPEDDASSDSGSNVAPHSKSNFKSDSGGNGLVSYKRLLNNYMIVSEWITNSGVMYSLNEWTNLCHTMFENETGTIPHQMKRCCKQKQCHWQYKYTHVWDIICSARESKTEWS